MSRIAIAWLAVFVALPMMPVLADPPLLLEATIPLNDVVGRIDHMFVAAGERRQRAGFDRLFVGEPAGFSASNAALRVYRQNP